MIEEILKLPIYRDERGEIFDFASFQAQRLHLVSMEAGAVRGNHVHDQDEIVCVIGGDAKCEMSGEDQISGECERVIVKGNLKAYKIKAGVKHTIRNVRLDTFYLVCFYGSLSGSS